MRPDITPPEIVTDLDELISWKATTSKWLLKMLYSSFLDLNLRENRNYMYASKACLSKGKLPAGYGKSLTNVLKWG